MNIAIIGVGKLGSKLCETLVGGDYSITLVDTNSELLDRLSQIYDVMTIHADARDIGVLESLDIHTFDYVIVATGRDENNMVIGQFGKELGCKTVIARVRDPEYMKHFEFIRSSLEIDYLVNPDFSITQEIFKYLAEKYTLSNGVFTSGSIGLIEDGDLIEINVYKRSVNVVGIGGKPCTPEEVEAAFAARRAVWTPKKFERRGVLKYLDIR